MGEKLKQTVEIPIWALTIIATLLIAAASFTYNFVTGYSALATKVHKLEVEVDELNSRKVEVSTFNMLMTSLEDIKSDIRQINNKLQ